MLGLSPLAQARGQRSLLRTGFTGANGTLLAAHTLEIGSAGTLRNGTWIVTGNEAQASVIGSAPQAVFTWPTAVDVSIRSLILTGDFADHGAGLVLRYTDNNNLWFVDVQTGPSFNAIKIFEYAAGVLVERAATSVTVNRLMYYLVDATVRGSVLTARLSSAFGLLLATVSYATMATGLASTHHGIRASHTGDRFDDLVIRAA